MAYAPLDAGLNPLYPVFLPAFQAMYVHQIVDHEQWDMFPAAKEMNWFDPDNEHWCYRAGLYSAGQATLEFPCPKEAMVSARDRDRTILVADSGGYQIGKNTFKGYEKKIDRKFLTSTAYDEMRFDILHWMEKVADYGMIIDFPVWAIGREGFIFGSYEDCLAETKRNYEFFRDNHDKSSPLRFLSVIQGDKFGEALNWYRTLNGVSGFPNRGWSFAGKVGYNPIITLKMILSLWRDGRLNEVENWLHILGQARLPAVFVFNVFQQCLNKYVPSMPTISYDVSSPFEMAGAGNLYTHAVSNSAEMKMVDKHIEKEDFTLSTQLYRKWCVWESPFAKDLDVKDFFDRGGKYDIDMRSYTIAAHHNLWVFIKGIEMMNDMSNRDNDELVRGVPSQFVNFRRDVHRIFENFNSKTNIANLTISSDYERLIK